MAGIFMGFTGIASVFGLMPAPTSVLITIGLTTLATGTFGAVLQTINHLREKADSTYAATSPVNARDIAITAVSNGLVRPQAQALLQETSMQNTPDFSHSRDHSNSTHFRDKVGAEQSLNARMNAILTGNKNSAASHSDRVTLERESALETPKAPTLH